MKTITLPLLSTLLGLFRSRAHLHLELLSLRQQLAMAQQKPHNRLRFNWHQRLFWVYLYRLWPGCLQTLQIFKPDTLIRWHHEVSRDAQDAKRYIPVPLLPSLITTIISFCPSRPASVPFRYNIVNSLQLHSTTSNDWTAR